MILPIASLAGFLPYAVLGPAIGVLVDRWDRKKIMICSDIMIAAAGAVLALIGLYAELPVWAVMLVLFIRSAVSLAMPVGLILSGLFADRIGVNRWFLLSGIFIVGIAVICPLIPAIREIDQSGGLTID